jgi:hypothetical protein
MADRDMCANVMMEEGYMRMSVEYSCEESKVKIQQAIANAEKELKLFPSVIRRAINDNAGNFSIEFGNEEGLPRDHGDFFDAVMKELDINRCAV